MNWRQKKKQRKNLLKGTAKQRRRNKKLCQRYPFLLPRSEWTGEVCWDVPYSYTLAEDFPQGWWKAFGLMMCEELRDDLIKCHYLDKFRFLQVKEKYGQLRAYTGGLPVESRADEIIDKYSHLSENICIRCGKPDVPMITGGWISPYCFHCYRRWRSYRGTSEEQMKEEYEKYKQDDCGGKMADCYTVRRYSKDGTNEVVYDISETANKIRDQWSKQAKGVNNE